MTPGRTPPRSMPTGSEGPHLGDALSALVDGELAEDALAGVRAHLAGCGACRQERATTAAVSQLLTEMPRLDLPPEIALRLDLPAIRLR